MWSSSVNGDGRIGASDAASVLDQRMTTLQTQHKVIEE